MLTSSADLRTYYVRFVLAIFMHGDVEAKKQALGVKNLISALFNGLDQDAYKVRGYESHGCYMQSQLTIWR